jgi:hypothetical protein
MSEVDFRLRLGPGDYQTFAGLSVDVLSVDAGQGTVRLFMQDENGMTGLRFTCLRADVLTPMHREDYLEKIAALNSGTTENKLSN